MSVTPLTERKAVRIAKNPPGRCARNIWGCYTDAVANSPWKFMDFGYDCGCQQYQFIHRRFASGESLLGCTFVCLGARADVEDLQR
jgi:hypothetical protein